ncbi:MAG: 5'/3'-nucleotidase SurE [Chloroflexota bacterium]|nr:5'/3'-nucleotidase SurE [Chloroflexota bacterium]
MPPLILITNDDGVYSPGLRAMAEAAALYGDLLIAAPLEQQTSMGRAKPRRPDGGIIQSITLDINGAAQAAYAVVGSPAWSVAHAVLELAPRKPDLCLSGINYGENIGFSLHASGTIGAALEAAGFDIPALAFSVETPLEITHLRDYAPWDWNAAKHFVRLFTQQTLADGLPEGVALLNINVPSDATEATPIKYTVQSRQMFYHFTEQPKRDLSQPYLLGEAKGVNPATLEPDSDVQALIYDRCVSVTPMSGMMTAVGTMVDLS